MTDTSSRIIPPGSAIGILGGGQLGRMLAMAAARLGYHSHVYCPQADPPAAEVAQHFTQADYTDQKALSAFAASVDVITLEFENIPTEPLAIMEGKLFPSTKILRICQHRGEEKRFLNSIGVPTASFQLIRTQKDITHAAEHFTFPAILKTSQFGYDGKGQCRVEDAASLSESWKTLKQQEAILEERIDFEREISVIIARNAAGNLMTYPPTHNVHQNHILYQTHAPSGLSTSVENTARSIARLIAEKLALIGLMAVEMFITEEGTLLVNELAPRPHNSGHWTLDAAVTDQFEQTIRTICGLPLGNTDLLFPATMTNLIGEEVTHWQEWLKKSHARVHLYGKSEIRPGRKMGHVTEWVKDT